MERKWFNQSQPQTMQIAVMLLYLTSAINLIRAIIKGGGDLFLLLTSAGEIGGAFGIANEQRTGYKIAVISAILPLALVIGLSIYHRQLQLPDFITLTFQIALIALLLHPQTREYEKIWFH